MSDDWWMKGTHERRKDKRSERVHWLVCVRAEKNIIAMEKYHLHFLGWWMDGTAECRVPTERPQSYFVGPTRWHLDGQRYHGPRSYPQLPREKIPPPPPTAPLRLWPHTLHTLYFIHLSLFPNLKGLNCNYGLIILSLFNLLRKVTHFLITLDLLPTTTVTILLLVLQLN